MIIQQGFVKLIETVIVKIDIVRTHLYFESMLFFLTFYLLMSPKKVSQVPNK